MWKGSFGSWDSVTATLNETAPLLIVALGTCIAGQAGLFNIGLEGQFMVGALGGVAVALGIHASSALVLPLIFLGAAVIGGLWAGIAALLKYAGGVNEVLTTLLLNFVAIELATYVLNKSYLLQAPRVPGVSGSNLQPQTSFIPNAAHLPILRSSGGNDLHFGIVIALAPRCELSWCWSARPSGASNCEQWVQIHKRRTGSVFGRPSSVGSRCWCPERLRASPAWCFYWRGVPRYFRLLKRLRLGGLTCRARSWVLTRSWLYQSLFCMARLVGRGLSQRCGCEYQLDWRDPSTDRDRRYPSRTLHAPASTSAPGCARGPGGERVPRRISAGARQCMTRP